MIDCSRLVGIWLRWHFLVVFLITIDFLSSFFFSMTLFLVYRLIILRLIFYSFLILLYHLNFVIKFFLGFFFGVFPFFLFLRNLLSHKITKNHSTYLSFSWSVDCFFFLVTCLVDLFVVVDDSSSMRWSPFRVFVVDSFVGTGCTLKYHLFCTYLP